MKRSSLELYKLEKLIEELEKKEGRGTELISLYIPPSRQIADVMSSLREEYGTAANIKSKSTRKNVQDAIESIMQRLKLFKKPPENGLVIFCGAIPQGGPGTEKIETYVLEPPEPINLYLYRCDSKFYLEPLKELLAEKEFYGLIVMDRSEATFAILKGRRVEIVETITSGVPGKHDAGGQSARRFERIIEQMAHEFYKRVGEHANEIFLQVSGLKGIIIGGPGPTKNEFAEGDYLHYTLKQKVLGVVDLGYTGEPGVYELIEKAKNILKDVQYVHEKKLVQLFLYYLAKKPELVTYGEKEVLEKLRQGQVKLVLVSRDVDIKSVKLRCSQCGDIKEVLVRGTLDLSKLEGKCEKCAGTYHVEEVKGFVDVLADQAEQGGARIEVISSDTEEGESLKRSFGGIAAILRYG
ncbi:MAG: peptide chain release factor 1 [Candidatus Methanomethylicota archaeon]|uniref:Peptide chain release factor subunit 1 n=1 Tax=Thermoproteota archaeon TaxID=2056631 RepID=A0A497ESP1_9CREN|nr:MAG: peptide chain release factor 1 [Candidatus Verstraetearchaeota archaeon]RLE52511.1 MAG: peptide chain release factor 1 [Candidatus Verstraetearchaeota archaeon]